MSVRYASRSLVDTLPITRPSPSTSSSYVCRQCRQTLVPSSNLAQQRRHASDGPPKTETWTERARKKLWQGKPPGPENIDDVYGGPGVFETMIKERREKRAAINAQRDPKAGSKQFGPRATQETLTEEENVFSDDVPGQSAESASGMRRGFGYAAPKKATSPPKSSPAEADLRQDRRKAAELQKQNSRVEKAALTKGVSKQDVNEFADDSEQVPTIESITTAGEEVRSWAGLEIIGHQGDWREMPANRADEYTPWQTMDKTLSWTPVELVALMHEAMTTTTQFSLKNDEQPDYHPGDARLAAPADTSFVNQRLDLSDKQTLQTLTRFSFLSRRRIPDPLLTTLLNNPSKNTIADFLTAFDTKTKPKPASVAETLAMNSDKLAGHPNLLVFGRRETPVDKEKEIGRWKIIEAELKSRGLPVLGRVDQSANRDRI